MSETVEQQETVKIQTGDKTHELPVVTGTYDEKGIDIAKLRGGTGYITLDPGYKNTGATTSSITYIDGAEGILEHRGYRIEDLAEHASFPEVIYLLLHHELPTQQQLDELNGHLRSNEKLPQTIYNILDAMPREAHPMSMLTTTLAALAGVYHDAGVWIKEEERWKNIYRLLGHMPTLCAAISHRVHGQEYIQPDPEAGYVEDFVYMMFGKKDKTITEALDTLLVLHADHEQNCSASSVRLVGSSQVNLFSAVSAGSAALWGPLHGGANQRVVEMLQRIREDGGDTEKYLDKAKDKEDPFRLMGFGHRVYKNFDPRAKVIKRYADRLLESLNIEDAELEIAKKLEKAALQDEYFAQRKLFPNVDFYSGIIYRALGIPTDMFTVMFALGRLPGWLAQWYEMREQGQPIGRPRQIYTGHTRRDYQPISERG